MPLCSSVLEIICMLGEGDEQDEEEDAESTVLTQLVLFVASR